MAEAIDIRELNIRIEQQSQFGVKIAVIVDEYDVPLQHTYETNQHDECCESQRNFFLIVFVFPKYAY